MKWRDTTYRAQYVVKRICAELQADPVIVWEILDEEFDKEPGATMTAEEASYLSDVVAASMKSTASLPQPKADEDLLTRQEAAALLKMHVNTLDIERAAGRLAYVQRKAHGRVMIPRKAVNDYLTRSTHPALPQRSSIQTYRKRRVS